jgi:tetratricopeptide (TPR) repeat protein
VAREPANGAYQHDVSVSLVALGDMARAAGDAPRARELFERALAIAEALAAAEPDDTAYQRDVLVSLDRLGDMARAAGDAPRARELFERALAAAEALAAGARGPEPGRRPSRLLRGRRLRRPRPANAGYRRDVAVSLVRLGDMAQAAGDAPRAHQLFERSLTIHEALAAAEPATAPTSTTCRSR